MVILHCGAIHPQTCMHACVHVCQNEKELIPFDKSELGHLECWMFSARSLKCFSTLECLTVFLLYLFYWTLECKDWAGLFYCKHINSSIYPNLTHLSTSWQQQQESKESPNPVHIFNLLPQITWHSLAGKNTTCIRMSVPLQLILKFLILSWKGWSLFLFFYFFVRHNSMLNPKNHHISLALNSRLLQHPHCYWRKEQEQQISSDGMITCWYK